MGSDFGAWGLGLGLLRVFRGLGGEGRRVFRDFGFGVRVGGGGGGGGFGESRV